MWPAPTIAKIQNTSRSHPFRDPDRPWTIIPTLGDLSLKSCTGSRKKTRVRMIALGKKKRMVTIPTTLMIGGIRIRTKKRTKLLRTGERKRILRTTTTTTTTTRRKERKRTQPPFRFVSATLLTAWRSKARPVTKAKIPVGAIMYTIAILIDAWTNGSPWIESSRHRALETPKRGPSSGKRKRRNECSNGKKKRRRNEGLPWRHDRWT
mmetsp:Transcript_8683/g.21360  ORF Transcript_8683/g.21360 Transcript_8683/m.21360 type:complete len:208 (+) Transcript_8683:307-930(+)